MMYPFERREKILERIRSTGRITIRKDAHQLGISNATIHRDLSELERLGLVKKVRGGAILSETAQFETHFDIRMKTRIKEKEEIARKAAIMVQDDTSIFLDHSSTVLYLARELKDRLFRHLIIVTNSLAIPNELAGKNGIQIILTGGMVDNEFRAIYGRWINDVLDHFNLSQIFVSVGAISLEHGLMTQSQFIRELLPEVFRHGQQINILADNSKFLKIGTFQIAPLDPSFLIFTDKGLPRTLRVQIEKKGPKVVI